MSQTKPQHQAADLLPWRPGHWVYTQSLADNGPCTFSLLAMRAGVAQHCRDAAAVTTNIIGKLVNQGDAK